MKIRVYTLFVISIICILVSQSGFAQTISVEVSGFVIEQGTRKQLRDVEIKVLPIGDTIATKADGSYRLVVNSVAVDTLIFSISHKGYLPAEVQIPLGKSRYVTQDIALIPIKYQADEILVEAQASAEIQKPTMTLSAETMQKLPTLVEPDVFRSMQLLPGVAVSNDFSSQVIIRGSDQAQTLTLIDQIPLYNAFHLGGFFSAINPDIVSRADVFASAYPVNYGGVASSVLSIATKSTVPERLTASASISVASSRAAVQAPIGNGMLLASARITYLDPIIRLLSGIPFTYSFYDLSGKYRFKIGENHTLSVSGMYVRDNYFSSSWNDNSNTFIAVGGGNIVPLRNINLIEPVTPHWGNALSSVQWQWQPTAAQTVSITAYTTASFARAAKRDSLSDPLSRRTQVTEVDNFITEQGAKSSFVLLSDGHRFTLGADIGFQRLRHSWNFNPSLLPIRQDVFFDFAPSEYFNTFSRAKAAIYASDVITFNSSLSASLGARAEYFSEQRQALFNSFARLEFSPDPNKTFYASYGRYYQSLVTLAEQRNAFFYSGFRVFFLPEQGRVPTADHVILGASFSQLFPNSSLTIEAYRVVKQNMPFISPLTREQVSYSEELYGVDAMLKFKQGALESWVSYSLGFANRTIGDFTFAGQFDQRHTVKAFLNYRLFNNLDVALSWMFGSGLPYSTAAGTAANDPFTLVFSGINNARAPLYHRLDLTLTHSFSMWGALAKPFLTLINLYSQNNSFDTVPPSVRFDVNPWPALSFIIPVIGVGMEF